MTDPTDVLARVKGMHRRRTERHGSGCVQCGIVWPCPTYRALDEVEPAGTPSVDRAADEQAALFERIAAAARTVPLRLGPNAVDLAQRGETIVLNLAEADEVAAAALSVLPAPVEPPLSPDYEHPECGFHWHGSDGMDIPMRDGQPVCPRCELIRAQAEAHQYRTALQGVARRAAVLPAPADRAAVIAATARACADHLRDRYSDTWTADAARSLELNAARIERGEPTALLRRLAAEARATAEPSLHGEAIHALAGYTADGRDQWEGDQRDDEAPATNTQAPASPSNRRAYVHNAITDALSKAGDWVPLSIRIAATRAALAEVDAWHAAEPAVVEPAEAADTETPTRGKEA